MNDLHQISALRAKRWDYFTGLPSGHHQRVRLLLAPNASLRPAIVTELVDFPATLLRATRKTAGLLFNFAHTRLVVKGVFASL